MGERNLAEIMYGLKVDKIKEFSTEFSFENFIRVAAKELGNLEGKFSFEKGSNIQGRGQEIRGDYFFGKPFNKILYSEKGIYDLGYSEEEVFDTMAGNLKHYVPGLDVKVDGDSFKISE